MLSTFTFTAGTPKLLTEVYALQEQVKQLLAENLFDSACILCDFLVAKASKLLVSGAAYAPLHWEALTMYGDALKSKGETQRPAVRASVISFCTRVHPVADCCAPPFALFGRAGEVC
jgi:hypothetical protein